MPPIYTLPRSKACQGCATAKAKCEPELGYTKCKRCSRNGLECVPKERASRKKRLLFMTGGCSHTAPGPEVGTTAGTLPAEIPIGRIVEEHEGRVITIPERIDLVRHYELEQCRKVYHKAMAPDFLFVLVPLEVPAIQFVRERPFLSLAVTMLGCTHDRARQRALALKGRQYLVHQMMEIGERTLDLLQGLLLLLHWYHAQIDLNYQRSMFMHLAMTLVVDLGLNKSPFVRSRRKTLSDAANGFEIKLDGVAEHSMEERRAYLGCLYLSIILSKCALNMDAMRFTDYAEECCVALSKSELPSDGDLVQILRLHQVVNSWEATRSSFTRKQTHRSENPPFFDFNFNSYSMPTGQMTLASIDSWDNQMAECWRRIPERAKTDVLRIHYNHNRVSLFEVALEESTFSNLSDRLNVLHRCVNAVNSQYQDLGPTLANPLRVLDYPSHIFSQSNHIMFISIQLITLKCEGWSGKAVHDQLDLIGMIEISNVNIENVLAAAAQQNPPMEVPSFFRSLVPVCREMAKWYAARLRMVEDESAARTVSSDGDALGEDVDMDLLGQFLNLDDSMWLQNALGTADGVSL